MQTTRQRARCPVYLHPAACQRHLIEMIQRQTGQFLVLTPQRIKATPVSDSHSAPWGGDAA
ncbi:hypothetical protein G7013_15900 [Pseudomonas viridiflava]|uniref:hypothetical protein n=1 Tax=Pseudomonas syringae group TaxID=136849 RepID=UPI0015E486C3|nr:MULTISPECIES: hypothetical protein [Pseudomonas syringae group]MBA1231133.1 hypothetical protein [Pseudomonas viridiflava]MCF5708353.1 hypothetical protein [Pseudomonas syringae]